MRVRVRVRVIRTCVCGAPALLAHVLQRAHSGRLAGARVPEARRPIEASRGELHAVCAAGNAHARDRTGVLGELHGRHLHPAERGVTGRRKRPDRHGAVVAASRQRFVGEPRHCRVARRGRKACLHLQAALRGVGPGPAYDLQHAIPHVRGERRGGNDHAVVVGHGDRVNVVLAKVELLAGGGGLRHDRRVGTVCGPRGETCAG